ncbi:phage terminase large subunit [Poseidonocella sp. HB161398]|uniref:phage terminase large subunit n=1 Tax=Poseidonocella sp. HB161398 TaxID=2320855 RepID=UPI00110809F5|nr:phage terminase large subunit [Poseidonocella sp. HB161398]
MPPRTLTSGTHRRPAAPPHGVSRADAARRLLQLRDASESFGGYVRYLQPAWEIPYFQGELIDTLDALEKNTLGPRNVLVTMPPRMAKSTYCTVFFPTYFMGRLASRFTMSCSYNAKLAIGFGHQVNALATDPRIPPVFPDFSISSGGTETFHTTMGGAYFAVGLGGTTSGRPANLLVLDDPIKARDEAESMVKRNSVWNYYTSALAMRLQPDENGNPPIQVVVLTRWHPDDVAGRLMRSEDWEEGHWHHVNYKGIVTRPGKRIPRSSLPADHPLYIPDIRKVTPAKRHIVEDEEASLWPKRFPLDDLQRRRRLNPREFASLYQQSPYVEGGNRIKFDWFRQYTPDLLPPQFAMVVIGVDTAFKTREQSDYSVAITAGMTREGDIYILDVLRGKYEFPDLRQRMIYLNNTWRGRGLRGFYIEDKASGTPLIQALRRHSGISVIPHPAVTDKLARATAVTPLIEGGRVYLPDAAPWLDALIDEIITFPSGAHDDQVDALVIVLDALSRTALTPGDWAASLDPALSLNRSIGHDSFGGLAASYGKSLRTELFPASQWKGWGQ